MRIKWGAVAGGIAGIAAIVLLIPSFLRHNTGARPDQFPAAFYALKSCADSVSTDAKLHAETFEHTVNGGVHIVSFDSLQRFVPGQPVAAITHAAFDTSTVGGNVDTTISIYTTAPADLLVLQHEFANALSWRHRRALIGSDTGRFLTSAFYKRCVKYCPRCAAGAY